MRPTLPLLLFVLLLCTFASYAQSPPGINYQGIARNPDGKPLALKDISIRVNIVKDGPSGEVEYSEVHVLKTNSFGLFNLVIGTGEVASGDFAYISWAIGKKWLRVDMDSDGGSAFQTMGSQQFMSVPYAFYARYSGNGLTAGQGLSITNNVITNTGDADKDATNEFNTSVTLGADNKLRITDGGGIKEADLSSLINTSSPDLTLTANTLSITNDATTVNLAPYLDNTDAQNLAATSSGTTRTISITNGAPAVIDIADNDNSTTNEIQNLSLTGNTLALSSDITPVDLAPYLDNTDSQTLTFSGNNLSIAGGNSVNLASLAIDGQSLVLAGSNLAISGANSVSLAPFLDNTDNQDLTLAGNTLSLTNDGTPINLAPYLDNTDNQDLALAGNVLSLTNDATAVNLTPYLDNTDNQDLILTGNVLSLTNDASPVNLTPYLDNTDNQGLSVTAAGTNRMISITGGTPANFSVADNDNDPVNEIQTLTYTPATKVLQISASNTVTIPETQNISQVLTQGNDAAGQKITNIGAPTANTDAVTKLYVDNADAAINSRISANFAFKTNFTYSNLLALGNNIPIPLSGESFDDFNVVDGVDFQATTPGTYVFIVDGSVSSILVGSTVSLLYNGTKYPVSIGANDRYNTTFMFRLTIGQTVSLVADGLGLGTNINGSFFGYKLL